MKKLMVTKVFLKKYGHSSSFSERLLGLSLHYYLLPIPLYKPMLLMNVALAQVLYNRQTLPVILGRKKYLPLFLYAQNYIQKNIVSVLSDMCRVLLLVYF
jgi:hypothetical protein